MIEELIELFEILKGKKIQKGIIEEGLQYNTEKHKIATIHLTNDSYPFFQLIKGCSNIFDTISLSFSLKNQTLEINGMDDSRISLAKIIYNDIEVYSEGGFEMDCTILTEILDVTIAESNKLEFLINFLPLGIMIREIGDRTPKRKKIAEKYNEGFEGILVTEISEDEVEFYLSYPDINVEKIPMDNLLQIDYPNTITMALSHFRYIVANFGIYSEIINFKFSDEWDELRFEESGQIGEQQISVPLEDLVSYKLEGTTTGAYSFSFLKEFAKMTDAMIYESEEDSNITIYLKTEHPLYLTLKGSFLSFTIHIFLAPRVEEADFDDDDDDMDEF